MCTLVTMDIGGTGGSRVRSYYSATSVTDVALYTEPEEIYLMKKNGDVVLYDATNMTEVNLSYSLSCLQFLCNINGTSRQPKSRTPWLPGRQPSCQTPPTISCLSMEKSKSV